MISRVRVIWPIWRWWRRRYAMAVSGRMYRGGYLSSDRQVKDLDPPPSGPAPGARCPTFCYPVCPAPCHEVHYPTVKRLHRPEDCPEVF